METKVVNDDPYKDTHNKTLKVNRRYILISALVLGVGAIFVKMGVLFGASLRPPVKPNSYGGMMRFGTLAELPPLGGTPQHVSAGRFWLVHDEDGVSALHSSCTHLDCLFTWDKEKGMFVCPCHGSEFAKDGTLLKGPATRSLDRFPVSLLGEDSGLIRTAAIKVAAPVPVKDLLGVQTPQEGNAIRQWFTADEKVFLGIFGRQAIVHRPVLLKIHGIWAFSVYFYWCWKVLPAFYSWSIMLHHPPKPTVPSYIWRLKYPSAR